jgi:hypothetical protein
MNKDFVEMLKSGELVPFDAAPAYHNDNKIIDTSIIGIEDKVIGSNSKELIISHSMLRKMIKDGNFIIKIR